MEERLEEDTAHLDRLWRIATTKLGPEWTINGSFAQRYHGNLNLRCDGVEAARLISELRELAFSSSSACASGSGRPSHVLKALGLSDAEARSSIRLGFGRYTSEQDIERAAELILEAAERQLQWAI
jgi:cysteine desulfurase